MKKILLLLLVSSLCIADDIYILNGSIIRNVKITGQSKEYGQLVINFLFNERINSVPQQYILRIDPIPYDASKQSIRENPTRARKDSIERTNLPTKEDSLKALFNRFQQVPKEKTIAIYETEYTQPNIHWLAISVLSFGLSWDFFSRAGDYQDMIDASQPQTITVGNQTYTVGGGDTSYLESGKTRMTILGMVSIGVGIFSAIHGFEKVEIKTDGKSLTLAVNF